MARLALVLLAIAPVGALAAPWLIHLWQLRQTGSVAVPPATANPNTVVRAFIRAIDVHDDRAARAMAAPAFIEHDGMPELAHFRLDRMRHYLPSHGDDTPEISAYRQIAEVSTDVTITQTWPAWYPSDNGGRDELTFTLVRNSDQDRWLVAAIGHSCC